MKHYFLICLLSLAAACTQAAVGVTQLPGLASDGPVAVFYPSGSTAKPVERGPFTLDLAAQGEPARGNGHLIVISHGSGGAPWVYADLARRLVEAGFTVALPEHQGDNWHDMSQAGPESWRKRPAEVSRAIDAVSRDARLAPFLSLDRVGMYGMSAGGHAALTLAGGRWSPSTLLKHCEAHLDDDFPTCVGLAAQLDGGLLDGPKKFIARTIIRHRLDDAQWYSHDEPRIKAVVAEVPFAVDFDMQSLATPRVPLGLVRAGQDKWLAPAFHIGAVLRSCTGCTLVADVPGAGHGSFMSPQPLAANMSANAARLLTDPPGFDRAEVPRVHAQIVAFFLKQLAP
ncbi:dienelactone hydrolase [soil metagenome]